MSEQSTSPSGADGLSFTARAVRPLCNWRFVVSLVVPMFFTSRFVNHNGHHWWVWWLQWRDHILIKGGHRESVEAEGETLGVTPR